MKEYFGKGVTISYITSYSPEHFDIEEDEDDFRWWSGWVVSKLPDNSFDNDLFMV